MEKGKTKAPGSVAHRVWDSRIISILPNSFSLTCPRRCQSLPTFEWLFLSVKIMSTSAHSCLAESTINVFSSLRGKVRMRHPFFLSFLGSHNWRGIWALKKHKRCPSFVLNSIFPFSTVLEALSLISMVCDGSWWRNKLGRASEEGNAPDSLGKLYCTMKNRVIFPGFRLWGFPRIPGPIQFIGISGPGTSGPSWRLRTVQEQSSLSACPFSICSSCLMSWKPGKKMWFLPWLSLHWSFKTSLFLGWWSLWLQTPHILDLNFFTSYLSGCSCILSNWACGWLPPPIMFIHCFKWTPLTSGPVILWKRNASSSWTLYLSDSLLSKADGSPKSLENQCSF